MTVNWRCRLLTSILEAYLDHLRVERALSPNTLTAYATDLAKLAHFAEERSVTAPGGSTSER